MLLLFDADVRNSTRKTTIEINNLNACEEYLFDVGLIVNDNIMGPLTASPKQFTTVMDESSPPKNLQVFPVPQERTKVRITWDAPCHTLSRPIGYNVREKTITYSKSHSTV